MPPESPHVAPGTSPFLLPALCSLSTCGLLGCDFLCLSVFLSKPLGDSEPIFLVLQCTISVSVRFLFVTFLAQLRTRLGTGGCSIDIHEMRASLPHALQRAQHCRGTRDLQKGREGGGRLFPAPQILVFSRRNHCGLVSVLS